LNFTDKITQIPSKFVGSVSDLAGSAVDELIQWMGIPSKVIHSGIGITEQIINSPLLLVNSLGQTITGVTSDVVKTSGNAAKISDSIENMITSPTGLMIAGIILLKSFS
jgi:hypothetical protein